MLLFELVLAVANERLPEVDFFYPSEHSVDVVIQEQSKTDVELDIKLVCHSFVENCTHEVPDQFLSLSSIILFPLQNICHLT